MAAGEVASEAIKVHDILDPHPAVDLAAAPQPLPSIADCLQSAPQRLKELLRFISEGAIVHVLAVLKSLYPRPNMAALGEGYALGMTLEQITTLLDEAGPTAMRISESIEVEASLQEESIDNASVRVYVECFKHFKHFGDVIYFIWSLSECPI